MAARARQACSRWPEGGDQGQGPAQPHGGWRTAGPRPAEDPDRPTSPSTGLPVQRTARSHRRGGHGPETRLRIGTAASLIGPTTAARPPCRIGAAPCTPLRSSRQGFGRRHEGQPAQDRLKSQGLRPQGAIKHAHASANSGQAGAGGRNRTGTRFPPTDFLTSYGFRRRLAWRPQGAFPSTRAITRPDVCGLDYPFAMARRTQALGAARLVSTPSRPRIRGRLGSGSPVKGSPNLSSSTSRVSRRRTQVLFSSSPLRLPVSPRPHAPSLALPFSIRRRRAPPRTKFAPPAASGRPPPKTWGAAWARSWSRECAPAGGA